MDIDLRTPGIDELDEIFRALGDWQHDTGPLHLIRAIWAGTHSVEFLAAVPLVDPAACRKAGS